MLKKQNQVKRNWSTVYSIYRNYVIQAFRQLKWEGKIKNKEIEELLLLALQGMDGACGTADKDIKPFTYDNWIKRCETIADKYHLHPLPFEHSSGKCKICDKREEWEKNQQLRKKE